MLITELELPILGVVLKRWFWATEYLGAGRKF